MLRNKALVISGSVAIGTSVLIIVIFALISLGLIETATNTLVIKTGSIEVEYDGQEHRMETFDLLSGTLRDGHEIVANFFGRQRDVGEAINTAEFRVLDADGKDVSHLYAIQVVHGTITVNPRPLAFRTNDGKKIYDAYPYDHTERTLEWENGTLVPGHRVMQRIIGEFTNAGEYENRIEARIYDENGRDVTSNYAITYDYGSIRIDPASIIIESASDQKVYDGMPLKNKNYNVIKEPLPGHQLYVEVVGEITDVGVVPNTMHVYVLDEAQRDVTQNYKITKLEGTLTVIPSLYSSSTLYNKLPNLSPELIEEVLLKVKGTKTETVYLRDRSFGNYNGTGWDSPVIYERLSAINPLSFSTFALLNHFERSDLAIHFNTPIPYLTPYYSLDHEHYNNDVHIYGEFQNPYKVSYLSYTFLPSHTYRLNDDWLRLIEREYAEFVYTIYLEIEENLREDLIQYAFEQGINKNSETIIADIQRLIQNAGTYNLEFMIPNNVKDIVSYFLFDSKEGICQHFASAGVLMYRAFGIPARYTTGFVVNTKANEWVDVTHFDSHAWVEIYIDGFGWVPIEVTPGREMQPHITVKPKDRIKMYDGLPLLPNDVDVTGFEQLQALGYTYEFVLKGSQFDVGNSTSYVAEFIIYDPEGRDVTHLFTITKEPGMLSVTPRRITIETDSAVAAYSDLGGVPLTAHGYKIVSGSLSPNEYFDEARFIYTGALEAPGEAENMIDLDSIKIFTIDGRDVTSNYEIIVQYGTLRVLPY